MAINCPPNILPVVVTANTMCVKTTLQLNATSAPDSAALLATTFFAKVYADHIILGDDMDPAIVQKLQFNPDVPGTAAGANGCAQNVPTPPVTRPTNLSVVVWKVVNTVVEKISVRNFTGVPPTIGALNCCDGC